MWIWMEKGWAMETLSHDIINMWLNAHHNLKGETLPHGISLTCKWVAPSVERVQCDTKGTYDTNIFTGYAMYELKMLYTTYSQS